MPSIKWHCIRRSPLSAVKIIAISLFHSIGAVAQILLHPSQPLSLRTAITRIWVGIAFGIDGDIFYSEPEIHDTQSIETNDTTTYVIPTTKPEDIKNADAVYIYCHGGGLFFGHPLQYLDEYKRWTALAAQKGKKLVLLAPKYPLSTKEKWPAQLDAMYNLYHWIQDQGIPPSKLVMGGDSAGANLVLLFLLHLRDHNPNMTHPRAVILHSPCIDFTCAKTRYTPRIANDYIFGFSAIAPFMNDCIRPVGMAFESPEISALLAENVGRLPPQLVYWSKSEIFASDAETWVERSEKAGVEVLKFCKNGMLHTFGLGWPFVGWSMQEECDRVLIDFVFTKVSRQWN